MESCFMESLKWRKFSSLFSSWKKSDSGVRQGCTCRLRWDEPRTTKLQMGDQRLKHRGRRGTQGRAKLSAGEVVAGDFQTVQVAEGGHCDGFGFEEFLSQGLQVIGGDGFDLFDQFVEILEVVEIHFLAGEV